MSVSVKKTGIVNSSGEIGANLIADTTNEVRTYTYPTSGNVDRFAKTTSVIVNASNYTLSFWAKSTVAGDMLVAHYYSPNTTTYAITNQGTTSVRSDGYITFTLDTQWNYYWVRYTQSETTSTKHVIFPRMNYSHGSGTVSVKCVKFEEGTKPTLWIPSTDDTDYFTNICGFNEIDSTKASIAKEYINATDFIEI